jgi:hypothetical protein
MERIMDRQDREAIQSLFAKLANVERQAPPRDRDAEAFISEQLAHHPHAPYYMAQTIVVQEQALNAAQAWIEELERQGAPRQRGGVVTSIFGDSGQPSRSPGSVPRVSRSRQEPFNEAPFSRSGGFLAGAAQTAMGVAGGILLGNMIAGMFGHDKAQASEQQADNSQDDSGEAQDASVGDTGFDDGGFGDIEI